MNKDNILEFEFGEDKSRRIISAAMILVGNSLLESPNKKVKKLKIIINEWNDFLKKEALWLKDQLMLLPEIMKSDSDVDKPDIKNILAYIEMIETMEITDKTDTEQDCLKVIEIIIGLFRTKIVVDKLLGVLFAKSLCNLMIRNSDNQ